MKDYFVEQADYQRWACGELFKSLDSLSDADRHADMGLFFRSAHKTVDHILLATRNWRARLTGEFDKVRSYDTVLYPAWDGLKRAVLEEFAGLGAWLETKEPGWFAQIIEYPAHGHIRRTRATDGLIQVMMHAVHHRGQMSAVCTRLGAPSPEMDFVFYRLRAPR